MDTSGTKRKMLEPQPLVQGRRRHGVKAMQSYDKFMRFVLGNLFSCVSARSSDRGGIGNEEEEPESDGVVSGGLVRGTVFRSTGLLPNRSS